MTLDELIDDFKKVAPNMAYSFLADKFWTLLIVVKQQQKEIEALNNRIQDLETFQRRSDPDRSYG